MSATVAEGFELHHPGKYVVWKEPDDMLVKEFVAKFGRGSFKIIHVQNVRENMCAACGHTLDEKHDLVKCRMWSPHSVSVPMQKSVGHPQFVRIADVSGKPIDGDWSGKFFTGV